MKKVLIVSLVCAMYGLFSTNVKAQDGIPVYLDYLSDNLYLLHPSMAGAAQCGKVRLTARQQWFDTNNAPNLQTLSFNTHIGRNSGIGAILMNDENGFHSQTGLYLSYAYHLDLTDSNELSRLSFGLSAGIVDSNLDETSFDLTDFDPVIAGIIQSDIYFNIDVGASYFYNNFSAHFTIKNLAFQNRDIFTEEFESANQRRYIATLAYYWKPDEEKKWALEPSVLYHYIERTDENFFDINLKGYYDVSFGQLWAALSYRRSSDGAQFFRGFNAGVEDQRLEYFSPLVGVNYGNFMFAYTYSYQNGDIVFDNGGFHQITLGLNFSCKEERWHCDCPAVN